MTCGKKPLGYKSCPREPEHDGPCAHEVDLESVAVDLKAIGIDFEAEDLDAFFWRTLEAIYGKRGKA